ncbi:TRAP transporter small permease [candidate division KSB1 bacterium]|nr:TRAP transporter small permease [candidate division KSB1 bacterium]
MQRIRAAVDRTLEWLVIALMGVMVLNVLWQVFTRFVLRDPSSYTEELARYLLIWVGLIGAGYAASQKMHLAIDILTMRLSGKSRSLAEMFIYLCTFLFALLIMVIGGMRLVNLTLTLNQISAALQIKLGYVYLALPLSGLIIMFYAGWFFAEQLRMLFDGKAMPNSNR